MNTLKASKRIILRGLEEIGFSDMVRASGWRSRRLAILCYHGISIEDEHEWNPDLFISQDLFAQRMDQLERGEYIVLPLNEAIRQVYDRTLPPRAVAITFDDGNYDFLAKALPVLASHEFPATVYLTTYYSENNIPVFDVAIKYVMWKGKENIDNIKPLFQKMRVTINTAPSHQELSATIVQVAKSKKWSAAKKDDILRKFSDTLGVDYQHIVERGILHIMNPDEVRQVLDAGVSVQLHTHRHRTPSDPYLFHQEIYDNSSRIRKITGSDPRHFCYPYGVAKPEFLPWLRHEGIVSATTTRSGLASSTSNPLLLPRIVDHAGLSALEFEGWLSGTAAMLPHRSHSHRFE